MNDTKWNVFQRNLPINNATPQSTHFIRCQKCVCVCVFVYVCVCHFSPHPLKKCPGKKSSLRANRPDQTDSRHTQSWWPTFSPGTPARRPNAAKWSSFSAAARSKLMATGEILTSSSGAFPANIALLPREGNVGGSVGFWNRCDFEPELPEGEWSIWEVIVQRAMMVETFFGEWVPNVASWGWIN